MDNKSTFKKYHDLFLILANSEEGREILNARLKLPIVKITPNALIYDTGEKIKNGKVYRGHFYSYEKMAKYLLPYLYKYEISDKKPIGSDEALEFFGSQSGLYNSSKFSSIYLDTGAYYTSAADGALLSFNTVWSTARGATTANIAYGTDTFQSIRNDKPDSTNYYLTRCFFPADTSGLTTAATIISGNLQAYIHNKNDGGANGFNAYLCQMTVANTSTLAVGDMDGYDSLGSPSKWSSDVDNNTPTVDQYYSFALNTTGLAAISKTGFTHMGMRGDRDSANSTPPDNATSYTLGFRFSEYSGSTDPYHDITFSLPAGGYIFQSY